MDGEKIHRELLSCSEFLVELLQDHEKESGPTSEDNPLHFVFCNVEEFRAFLWALYATYVPSQFPSIQDILYSSR